MRVEQKLPVIIIILIIVGLSGCTVNDLSDKNGEDTEITYDDIPSCGDITEFFSVSPVNLSDFMGVLPLGNLNPPAHTFPTPHLYFFINWVDPNGPELGTLNVPVYSPGDIIITRINEMSTISSEGDFTDYSIHFSVCSEFTGYFNHLASISDKLMNNFTEPFDEYDDYSDGVSNYSTREKNVNIKLNPGDQIGTIGGPVGTGSSLDFGTRDYRITPLDYANPNRWGEGWFYVVCPLDYFTSELKDSLKEKLGSHYGEIQRTVEPICGCIEQDEPGTAQGVWFLEGTTVVDGEQEHIALVHDNIDPTRGVFSVGSSVQSLSSGRYFFTPEDSGLVNRDFNDVEPGEIYCYETEDYWEHENDFIILLELIDDYTLRIEKQDQCPCGNGPWAFGSEYTEFER